MVTQDAIQTESTDAIVGHAKQLKADLIAMTTHGRSGLTRTIMGSVADEVVHTAPCPVLLVRLNQPGNT
jgi:nucleotide-binding universal stress UspA family protein